MASHFSPRVRPATTGPLKTLFAVLCLLLSTIAASAQDSTVQQDEPSRPVHIVRKLDSSTPKNQSPAAQLFYYGGPVISNVQVVVVFWGSNVSQLVTGQMGDFFQAITNSAYFDLMSEYSTSVSPIGGGSGTNQSIGRGSFAGAYTITPSICASSPCSLTDPQVQAEIIQQIDAGNLPTPALDGDGNVQTLYMTYFPAGVSISLQGHNSCEAGGFCAYHGTTTNTFNSKHVIYGVVPDFSPSSGCYTGCGGGTEFQNLCSVSSHELAESVTDADVGIVTKFASPLGWYDPYISDKDGGGEIGDICTAQQDQVVVGSSIYTVQQLWSNLEGACVSVGAHPSFQIAGPNTVGSTSFNFTVTAQNPVGSSIDTSFVGTAHFSSTDPHAVLPADYKFTPVDGGVQTFSATLKTSGAQTITVTELVDEAITGGLTVTVNALTQAPAFTSGNSATFAVGNPGSFAVTATGTPVPSLTATGILPTGVKFVDNKNGTGLFSGTPAAGTNGTYALTLRAHSTVAPDATQAFTLIVNVAPAITSASSTNFNVGSSGSFTVKATGSPTPSLTETGTLPAGITFVDNGNGTGTLGGTPAAGTTGSYNITFTAHNTTSPDATQAFTLTVNPAFGIISPNNTTFTVGTAGSFTVQAAGTPTPALTRTGVLPSGVSFVNNRNGTGTLSGTPADGTDGTYTITFKAHNGVFPDVTQTFTLKVNPAPQAPTITSANATTFSVGLTGSFTITTTGIPTPSLLETGTLPTGVAFLDNGDGTATLSGSPAAGVQGTYRITFKAHNQVSPDATQTFTLKVNAAPSITSANTASFTENAAGSFTVTATGTPTPSLAESGALPQGLSFVNNGDGTGTLSGTPGAGTSGTYNITFKARSSALPAASQAFTLVVNAAPAITSANSITFTTGTASSFTITTTGTPVPSLTETGSLPSGISFSDSGNGTATLTGIPAVGTTGTYKITITAHNVASPDAIQAFTLIVNAAPVITSANNAVFTVGTEGSFTVTASGTPTPSLSKTGYLPAGVTFVNNRNGTATLSGTPALGTNKTYTLTIKAHNVASPDAMQTFTLTVKAASGN